MREFSRHFQQLLNRLDKASGDVLSEIGRLQESLNGYNLSPEARVALNELSAKVHRLDALIPASFEIVE